MIAAVGSVPGRGCNTAWGNKRGAGDVRRIGEGRSCGLDFNLELEVAPDPGIQRPAENNTPLVGRASFA